MIENEIKKTREKMIVNPDKNLCRAIILRERPTFS